MLELAHASMASQGIGQNLSAAVSVTLKQKMATRSGPGTKFTSTGTFPKKTEIKALEKIQSGSTVWVLVEFKYKNSYYRAYTGLKRISGNKKNIPQASYSKLNAELTKESICYYGPGTGYAIHKDKLSVGTKVTVLGTENGYAHIDVSVGKKILRTYVPEANIKYN